MSFFLSPNGIDSLRARDYACAQDRALFYYFDESSTSYCQPHTHSSSSISTHGTLGCAPEFSSTQKKLISLKTLRAVLREEIRVYSEQSQGLFR